MTLGFIPSDACVLVVQAGMVAAPRRLGPDDRVGRLAARLQSRWWALVPLGSIVVVIFAISAASGVADGLTWLSLVAIPVLAALAFGWAVRGTRWWLAGLMPPLLAVAWIWPGALWGQACATLLTAFSCVTLGVLLAAVTPPSWLKVGIILMAMGDTYLVLTDLLQAPNNELVAAAPSVAGLKLPQLQGITFGDILLGYGDVFVAAVLGAVIARERRGGWGIALLTLAIAGGFDLLFLVLAELPATVPVALALIVSEGLRWRRRRARRAVGGGRAGGAGGAGGQWASSSVEAGGRDSSASEVIASVPRAASSSTSVASSAERE